MVAWSGPLLATTPRILQFAAKLPRQVIRNGQVRLSSDHHPKVFHIQPTRWQWTRFKDLLHFYVMLGVVPLLLITTWVNIFVGPATLEPIPEGYVPKHWEYYRHPIQRFLSRYFFTSMQQEYEKDLARAYQVSTTAELRKLEKRIKYLQQTHSDYAGTYFRPFDAAKFIYFAREEVANTRN